MDALQCEKRGYLLEPFRLFHLDTALTEDTAFHFHDFHKLVFFLDGVGNYYVEGKSYALKPDDIVVVRQGTIHKADIDPTCRYERIILYIDPEYLREKSTGNTQLDRCFHEASKRRSYVLRPDPVQRDKLMQMLLTIERMLGGKAYGQDLCAEMSLMQLLIDLGRGRQTAHYRFTTEENKDDKTVALILYDAHVPRGHRLYDPRLYHGEASASGARAHSRRTEHHGGLLQMRLSGLFGLCPRV